MPHPAAFTLTHEPAAGLLVGRWPAHAPAEDLRPAFERLVEAAKAAGNCRFWLLDLRERAAFHEWFRGLLSQQVVRELGKPVFVACVAAESSRAEIESVATQVRLRQQAQDEFYPYFFSDEAAAREWLAYHQQLATS